MFNLLQPIFLYGFLGLLIPIAIHLWNRREGKVLKIGTVRWMQKSSSTRFSKVKFHDWLLFLIRAVLIAMVVLMLAELVWEQETKTRAPERWALVDPNLKFDNPFIAKQIDSLSASGYTIKQLDYSFNNWKNEVDHLEDKFVRQSAEPLNYWSVVASIKTNPFPPEELVVLTNAYIKNFQGNKPDLSIPVHWLIIPEKEPSFFISEARTISQDTLHVQLGKTASDYTQFFSRNVGLQQAVFEEITAIGPDLQLRMEEDSLFLKQGMDSIYEMKIRKPDTVKIALIYKEDQEQTYLYWDAAFTALKKFKHLPFQVSAYNFDKKSTVGSYDWVVDLTGEASIDDLKDAEKIFIQALQDDSPSNSWFTKGQRDGQVIFTINQHFQNYKGRGNVSQSLPEALMEIYEEGSDTVVVKNDRRVISSEQIALPEEEGVRNASAEKAQLTDLTFWLWLLAVLLFLIERVYAGKRG